MSEPPLRRLLLWGCSVRAALLLALCAVVLYMMMNIFSPFNTLTPLGLTATAIASTNFSGLAVLTPLAPLLATPTPTLFFALSRSPMAAPTP
ncbi:MAG: hypothetical protein U0694_07190 [Anaerolineae bacterium]